MTEIIEWVNRWKWIIDGKIKIVITMVFHFFMIVDQTC